MYVSKVFVAAVPPSSDDLKAGSSIRLLLALKIGLAGRIGTYLSEVVSQT